MQHALRFDSYQHEARYLGDIYNVLRQCSFHVHVLSGISEAQQRHLWTLELGVQMVRHVNDEPHRGVGNACLLVAILFRGVLLRSVRRLAMRQHVMLLWLRSLVEQSTALLLD